MTAITPTGLVTDGDLAATTEDDDLSPFTDRELIEDTYRMMRELYTAFMQAKPAFQRVTGEINENGIAGLMGVMLRGGR